MTTTTYQNDSTAYALAAEQAQRRRAGHTAPMTTDPITLWNAAIAAHVQRGMVRSRAISTVMHEQPALTAAYNAARMQTGAAKPARRR